MTRITQLYDWSFARHGASGPDPMTVAAGVLRSRATLPSWSARSLIGFQAVAEEIIGACDAKLTIAVHGDYDVDGLTSARIIADAIALRGHRVAALTASSRENGYGLSMADVPHLSRADVVILTDLGTSSAEAVSALAADGARVLCVDHHEPPPAFSWRGAVICNPKLSSEPGSTARTACSATLAVRLFRAITGTVTPDMDALAAIGIIGDMADMRCTTNRDLAMAGLSALTRTKRPGLRWLLDVEGLDGDLCGDEIVYNLIPILNAPGRVGDTDDAVRALGDGEESYHAARTCHAANVTRRALCKNAFAWADEKAEADDSPAIVLVSDHVHMGIVGLVAARICRRLGRPAAVGRRMGDRVVFSFRAPPNYSLMVLCAGVPGLPFGGHDQAGGATVLAEDVDAVTAGIVANAAALPRMPATLTIDGVAPLWAINETLITIVDNVLVPYGHGWPRPVLLARNCRIESATKCGMGQRLAASVNEDGRTTRVEFLSFDRADVRRGMVLDIAYSAEVSRWGGRETVRLIAKDVRESNGADKHEEATK